MEQKVMAILSEICGVDESELSPDTRLFDLGLMDSFAVVQLLVEVEANFSANWDMETLKREEIATPGLIIAKIKSEVAD